MEKRTRTCDGCGADVTDKPHWKVTYEAAMAVTDDRAPRHYCFDCIAQDAMPKWRPGI